MFNSHNEYHKRSGGGIAGKIFGLFRLMLSLAIMGVLFLGVFQAYKSFAGVDPLHSSPKAIISNLLSSEDLVEVITSLLDADPKTSLDKAKSYLEKDLQSEEVGNSQEESESGGEYLYSFAIISDSHNDNQNLAKALDQAQSEGAEFIIGLGDYTDVGTTDELINSKVYFDRVGMPYYLLPGDHDLWDSRDKGKLATANFSKVFGPNYSSFKHLNTRFILIDNSDNYLGVDGLQEAWILDELNRASDEGSDLILAFIPIPLYHPSSDHFMGKTESKLRVQAERITNMLAQNNVREVFAADAHFFTRYTEPKNSLKMTVVGAVTAERNIQEPRFVMVDIFTNGEYNVRDIIIE